MKRTVLLMIAFSFILTGCASVETGGEKTATPTETNKTTVSADNSQMPIADLTAPPALTVSTLNNVDSVSASCSNSHWSYTLPDGITAASIACGPHPLEQQEYSVLHTAFPAGTLPPLEEGSDIGSIIPVFYLDFGGISPETVSAIRWPASYIGDASSHSTDFEEVIVALEDDMIILVPLGDGDYVYEISATWGETRGASYTFRTSPQIRGEQ